MDPFPTKDYGLYQDSHGKPTRLFEGRVKSIQSGDTVVIWPTGTKGGTVEREITLSLCIAPRIGRPPRINDLHEFKEEPFAFLSREYLRKALVSKIVQFTIDFSHPSGREYGVLYYNDKCVNESSILRGWSTVKDTEKPKSEMHARLFHHNAEAKNKKIGMYSENNPKATRKILVKFNKEEFYQQRKDSPQNAIVEQVIDGSTLRVLFFDKNENSNVQYSVYLRLSGIICPTFNKTLTETEENNQEWSISAEPFAQEAKYFTEFCILQRDVQVLLGGVNKDGAFFGTLTWEGKNPVDELLSKGLGTFQQWSARKEDIEKFSKLSQTARENKLGVYKSEETEKTKVKSTSEHHGRVINIMSGSKVVVRLESGVEETVYFGSILAPRISKDSEEPLAWEAREFVRKTLIGKNVRLVLDYIRMGEGEGEDNKNNIEGNKPIERRFYSVYLGKQHIPTTVVSKGFADVVQHRRSDTPSPHYQEMLDAEKEAKQQKLGKWAKTVSVRRIHDRSKDSAQKSKQYLPFLKKSGKIPAIVEYVANASRYKIFVPSDNCFISFTVGGIKCPWVSKEESEPLGEESLEFTRDLVHQRKVEIEVEACDKGGNFIGHAYLNNGKDDVAQLLLKNGFATLLDVQGVQGARLLCYQEALEHAKINKLNLWRDYDPQFEIKQKLQKEIDSNKQERLNLKVTYVVDGNWFYAQFITPELQKLEPLMNQLQIWNQNYKKPSNLYFKIDDLCCVRRHDDNLWYRVQIQEKVSSWEFRVIYIDFGFGDIVDKNEIRVLPEQFNLKTLSGQAKECYLALIKVPSLSDEYGDLAASYLSEMIEGKTLFGQIEYRNLDYNTYFMSLADYENKYNINKAMVLSGLARVNKRLNKKQCENLLSQLLDEQDKAKKERRNLWRLTDNLSDEEDD